MPPAEAAEEASRLMELKMLALRRKDDRGGEWQALPSTRSVTEPYTLKLVANAEFSGLRMTAGGTCVPHVADSALRAHVASEPTSQPGTSGPRKVESTCTITGRFARLPIDEALGPARSQMKKPSWSAPGSG